jgi:predicted RNA binding protein YcfA (HicA-like mRNA interferase family)
MGRLPVLKPREVCRLLEDLGFVPVRQRGAHLQYRHPDGRGTTVPMHPGRDIPPHRGGHARDVVTVADKRRRFGYGTAAKTPTHERAHAAARAGSHPV